MSLKVASFGYVPPKGWGCAESFLANLEDFAPRHECVLFSDWDWGKAGMIRLKQSPDFVKNATFVDGPNVGQRNPFALHNIIFLAGLKICRERGITHAIYLEQDCRVGRSGWDEVIFEEYFDLGRPCIVAGTLSVYNPSNSGLGNARAFQRLIASPPKHGIPMGTYGWTGAATQVKPTMFPNGALAVYDVEWMAELFNLNDQGGMATQNTAFDLAIGNRLWDLLGIDALDAIGSLGTIYSGFGDALTTPEQRRALLTSGKVVAMHQEKSEWRP